MDNLDKPLTHFRTSANALYTFLNNHKQYYLRLAPLDEKLQKNVFGELEFIQYLRTNNYPALKPLLSITGDTVEIVSTPWGEYYASLFEGVSGGPLDRTDFNDEIMFEYGKKLGQLHLLSSKYTPIIPKWTHEEVLEWMKRFLIEKGNQDNALKELADIKQQLAKLPKTNALYGLVHYDFELDNVFYNDNDKTFAIIDFDDGMYNWYGLDIDQVLDSLGDELNGDKLMRAKQLFLEGYRKVFSLSEDVLKSFPLFRRFVNLYGYTRVSRCVEDQWDNEPPWLIQLRYKLSNAMAKKMEKFIV